MIETNSKKGFWQFPIALKFVVIWTGLLGLFDLWNFIYKASEFHVLDFWRLVDVLIWFALVIGLINKRDSAKIWTSIFVGISVLVGVIVLGWIVFTISPADSFTYELFNNEVPMTRFQMLALPILFIVYNVIILYILLRPSTKALFSAQPAPLSEPSIPDHSAQA